VAGPGVEAGQAAAGVAPDPLGPPFRWLAGRYGTAPAWRAFVGGMLAAPPAAVAALAVESVPATPAECAALAARHRLGRWLPQRTVEMATRRWPVP
jgi:hypothetical protein